jgi:predicted O-linked N-acetylglucosamine transferase (SPINDLY family)
MEAFFNRGMSFKELHQFDSTLLSLQQALILDDRDTDVHFHLVNLYEDLQLFEKARHHLQRVLALNPDTTLDCLGTLMSVQMKTCDWKELEQLIERVKHRVQVHKRSTELLPLLAISDDPEFLRQAGKTYSQEFFPCLESNFQTQKSKSNSRLVVGYFSSDFNNHPVAHLISEVFELHDRSQFEVHAFSLSRKPHDSFTQRIIGNVDFYWECGSLSQVEVLNLSRQRNLDIAIDLNGLTGGCRMEIFANRVAPVQINYLGFPGTVGSDYHDYIVADEFLIPPAQQVHYSEKVIYLPCFQANDRKRRVSDIVPLRAQFNLPDDAFVFCCFNNAYKIQPTQFACWMRILLKTPQSVLWILTDSIDVETNLQNQAQALGVAPDRLIFSKKMAHSDYLASYVCADLFLDTYPFNAGTTANDALWMGLPLITMSGNTFASRMAGSLLHAVGLPELITTNLEDYENLAVELANDPNRIEKLRQKLKANRSNCLLFDSPLFVSKLEEQYTNIHKSEKRILNHLKKNELKIRFVVATRCSREDFFIKTATGKSLSLYQSPFLELDLYDLNSEGLPAIYNRSIEKSKNDSAILVFAHDDIHLTDFFWADQLKNGLKTFDIVGVAGNTTRAPYQPSWAFIDDNFTWDKPENLSGIVGDGFGFPPKSFSVFGDTYQEVKLLDGVFIACHSEFLNTKNLRFDTQFDFHFYDLDFCREAERIGARMGTWSITLIHESGGAFGSSAWTLAKQKYFAKWGN